MRVEVQAFPAWIWWKQGSKEIGVLGGGRRDRLTGRGKRGWKDGTKMYHLGRREKIDETAAVLGDCW